MTYERMSADGYQARRLNFARQHTGPDGWDKPTPPLRPVWPLIAGGLALMLIGAAFTCSAGNAAAGLGGLVISMAGIVPLARAAWLLGKRQ